MLAKWVVDLVDYIWSFLSICKCMLQVPGSGGIEDLAAAKHQRRNSNSGISPLHSTGDNSHARHGLSHGSHNTATNNSNIDNNNRNMVDDGNTYGDHARASSAASSSSATSTTSRERRAQQQELYTHTLAASVPPVSNHGGLNSSDGNLLYNHGGLNSSDGNLDYVNSNDDDQFVVQALSNSNKNNSTGGNDYNDSNGCSSDYSNENSLSNGDGGGKDGVSHISARPVASPRYRIANAAPLVSAATATANNSHSVNIDHHNMHNMHGPNGRDNSDMSLLRDDDELLYLKFVSNLTREILQRGCYSDRAVTRLCDDHVSLHAHLDAGRMAELIESLKTDLNIATGGSG